MSAALSFLFEMEHDVDLGRQSFLDPSYCRRPQADDELAEAFNQLFEINQELLQFGAVLDALKSGETVDLGPVSTSWSNFKTRRQAARDRWLHRIRQRRRARDLRNYLS